MAFPLTTVLLVGLILLGPAPVASAQAPSPAGSSQAPAAPLPPTPDGIDPSLSPECRVPGSKLYTLAPLKAVKQALRDDRAIRVLAIGSSSTAGVGASSPLASYPSRLEGELERLFKNVEVEVINRGISGEVAAGAAERMMATTAEVHPDLVIWQVGTNDALARVDVEEFNDALEETIRWLKSHRIDVVLIDPQYTASLGKDDYYGRFVKAIKDTARRNRVPLVLRYEAMQFLSGQRVGKSYLALDQFHLNDLGYRCMAEHVARAIAVGLLQDEPPTPGATPAH